MAVAPVASIVPVGKRVLVRTARPTMGVIIAAGDEVNATRFVDGVSVLFPKYAGTEIELDGEKLLILDVESVLAIANRKPFGV